MMVNGLKFVLWQLSASIPETAVQSLLCAAYGEEKRIGLESYDLPKSLVDPAKTEEEIENSLASFICAERVPDVDRAAEDLKIFLVAIIAECKGLCTVGCGEG
ncbi:Protein SMAX1-LIKE [Trichinella pseudospiralis]